MFISKSINKLISIFLAVTTLFVLAANSSALYAHAQAVSQSNVAISPVYYLNWSGYANTGKTFTKAEETFKIPTVACTQNNAEALFWVGLDGYSNNNVQQAGIEAVCAGANHKTVQYSAFWEMFPTYVAQPLSVSVAPGNIVTVSVSYSSPNFTMQVVNNSRNTSAHAIKSCDTKHLSCSRNSAEWIAEQPKYENKTDYPLAKWSTIDFYNDESSTNSTYESMSHFTSTPIDMLDQSSNFMATVGQLSSGGNSFNDTWKAAN